MQSTYADDEEAICGGVYHGGYGIAELCFMYGHFGDFFAEEHIFHKVVIYVVFNVL